MLVAELCVSVSCSVMSDSAAPRTVAQLPLSMEFRVCVPELLHHV